MASTNRDLVGCLHLFSNTVLIAFLDEQGNFIADQPYFCRSDYASEIQQFFDRLPSVIDLKRVKAIVFGISDELFPSFSAAYIFRLKCREFCQKYGIFSCFQTHVLMRIFAALSHTQTMVKEDEKVLIIQCMENDQVSGITVIREKNCYRYLSFSKSEVPQFTQEWKKKLLGNTNPKKVVIASHPFTKIEHDNRLKELFKKEDAVIYKPRFEQPCDGVYDIALHRMGEKINPYHVSNNLINKITVMMGNDLLIAYTPDQTLPFEVFDYVFVEDGKSIRLYSEKPPELIKEIKLSSFKCKKVKVSLKIDQNAFYDVKVQPVDDERNLVAEDLSKMDIVGSTSTGVPTDKARIIFDEQNFTVLLNSKGKQYVVENEDDSDTTPIYIAFTGKKPIIGASAKKIYDKKPKFVVFDLIKLCSIDNADVMSPKWGFKLEKEENESLVVTMDTVEGERRSSVDFLLALILKHGLQIIKNENGKKMDELEIYFDGFIPNEMLKKNFEKAASLINLKIVFV